VQRTRIVCTLGPASDSDDCVRAMIRTGMDAARLNFSHGDHDTHSASIERVRRIAAEERAAVAIVADLQGPKIRVGKIAPAQVTLKSGSTFTLTTRPIDGDATRASVDFPALPQAVHSGDRVLLSDGLIELQVLSTDHTDVVTRVINGGELSSHKGVNLPGAALAISALTDKDHADLAFAIDHGADYIAQSFVRSAADVIELKRLIAARGADIPVIAKIEKREAIEQIDRILEASDALMVARGDLGVEAPPEQVPLYQKTLIRKANAAGKPVITATQMLESMIEQPRPTRAEASDVANAILDGTDAVMLSAETAVGRYPVPAVEMMERIADVAESGVAYNPRPGNFSDDTMNVTDAIGLATCEMAMQLHARLIITATHSGHTARMIARHRPQTPIFAVTTNEQTCRRLALVWGIQSALVSAAPTTEAVVGAALQAAMEQGVAKDGDLVIVTGGAPPGVPGRTNMIQVRLVGDSA
jgi:pyruvate kinase